MFSFIFNRKTETPKVKEKTFVIYKVHYSDGGIVTPTQKVIVFKVDSFDKANEYAVALNKRLVKMKISSIRYIVDTE